MSMSDEEIPPAAAAVVALLNSRPHSNQGETLADGALRDLRTALVETLTATDPAPAWAEVTARTAPVTYQEVFTGDGVVELRRATGDPALGRAAAQVAELVRAGRWSRLKLCAYDRCGEAFYDTSRNRTRRWHSYEICGNRSNVAAYRARAASS
jgi:predicted RNA-binding Zn ribbon-like protein